MKKIILILILAVNLSYALDAMYDYRYTFGPEIVVPDAFFMGFGGWTRRMNDLYLMSNIQVGLTNRFEMGAKLIGGVHGYREKWHRSYLADLGAKFAISRNLAIQADIPFEDDLGGVISLSQWDGYTKNVSFEMAILKRLDSPPASSSKPSTSSDVCSSDIFLRFVVNSTQQ